MKRVRRRVERDIVEEFPFKKKVFAFFRSFVKLQDLKVGDRI
jgi:hypothetical protein